MNINNISNTANISSVNVNTSNSFIKLPVQKPDTFEKSQKESDFNLDAAMDELKEIKGIKGTPRFNEEKLELIKGELQENPEKWEPFRSLARNPKMIGSVACEILKKDVQDIKNIVDITELRDEDGNYRFTPLNIRFVAQQIKGDEILKFKELAASPLDIDNLIKLSKDKNLTNTKRVVEKTTEMKKLCSDNLLSMQFGVDEHDSDAYSLVATKRDNSKKIQLYDRNLKTTSIEDVQIVKHQNGKQYQIKKSADYRNNTTSKVTLEVNNKLPQPVFVSEVRIVKDKNGKVQRTEYSEQSEIPGVLNVKHVMPDGSEKVLSSGTKDNKTGITSVKKDMTSLDGTRTQYLYEDDPQGNRIIDYKITDKKGRVLLNNSQTFEVISDNKFVSSKNGDKYEIEVGEKEINVKDVNKNKMTTLSFENYIDGNKDKLMTALKRMPGEELIALGKTTKRLVGIDDIFQSTYGAVNKRIKTGDNLFVMLHELGHAKDYENVDVQQKETLMKSIYSNPKVNKVFEEEKSNFNKAFPNAQREHINYFIKTSDVGDGIQEAIAESNAMLNTYNNDDLFSVRSQYLQQFFPRTIATLSSELNK